MSPMSKTCHSEQSEESNYQQVEIFLRLWRIKMTKNNTIGDTLIGFKLLLLALIALRYKAKRYINSGLSYRNHYCCNKL